jgi:hypothetical protein
MAFDPMSINKHQLNHITLFHVCKLYLLNPLQDSKFHEVDACVIHEMEKPMTF